ncbi:MAG: LON peptidase substrate-binding domain-containing protein [Chloroflexi bacterium]|nr:LON peptidase substrate-binding domain-containing protein [Chloroflexota bacterium]
MPEALPLFPLNVVLFPGMLLPLHIFEPRYREMIGLCSAERRSFGVALIKEGQEVGTPATPYEIGTTAQIVELDRLDDGRMNIITMGARRFRLVDYSKQKQAYLMGDVEYLEDRPSPPDVAKDLSLQVAGLAQHYVAICQTVSGQRLVPLDIPPAPDAISFVVGSRLQIRNTERQDILESESVVQRLLLEKDLLEREIERLEEHLRNRNTGTFGPFSRN